MAINMVMTRMLDRTTELDVNAAFMLWFEADMRVELALNLTDAICAAVGRASRSYTQLSSIEYFVRVSLSLPEGATRGCRHSQ